MNWRIDKIHPKHTQEREFKVDFVCPVHGHFHRNIFYLHDRSWRHPRHSGMTIEVIVESLSEDDKAKLLAAIIEATR